MCIAFYIIIRSQILSYKNLSKTPTVFWKRSEIDSLPQNSKYQWIDAEVLLDQTINQLVIKGGVFIPLGPMKSLRRLNSIPCRMEVELKADWNRKTVKFVKAKFCSM